MHSEAKITPPDKQNTVNQCVANRNQRIDLVKIVGMLGVIMLHTSHPYMKESLFDVASIMYKSAVVSIPLFFMMSGYLLLQRSRVTYGYVFRKLFRIFRYVSIFIIAYWLAHAIFEGSVPAPGQLLADYVQIVSVKGPFFVFWYFVSFGLVYLLLPGLSFLMNERKSWYYLILALLLSVQSAVFAANMVIGVEKVNACLRLYNWVTYFMIGGALYRPISHIRPPLGLWPVIILMLVNYITQYLLVPGLRTNYCSIFYSSGVVILASICICLWALTNGEPAHKKVIDTLSGCFLLVFTIHPFIIPIGLRISSNCNDSLAPVICWGTVCIISIIVSLGMKRIPVINKFLTI